VHEDEQHLINSFIEWIATVKDNSFLLTKNGKEFDIPFILSRLSQTIDLDEHNGLFLKDMPHFDLQDITKRRVSLQTMTELFNCKQKSGTGINAIQLWKEKRYKELKSYCTDDVEVTEEAFLKWRALQGDV